MSQRIGLYGGSFDPVHHGHLIIARHVAEQLDWHETVLLPSASPPHKQGVTLAEPRHRLAMLQAAVAGEPGFTVSDYDLTRPGPSYTVETVAHFAGVFGPPAELYWLIGADSLAELPTWHRAGELVDACHVVTAQRHGGPGVDWDVLAAAFTRSRLDRLRAGLIETPVIDIAATDIRARVSAGRSVRYLTPAPVADYIEAHALYRTPGDRAPGHCCAP